MRKLEIKDAEIMRLAVEDEIQRSEQSRYDHRLHGILLLCSGLSCGEVAELFDRSRRAFSTGSGDSNIAVLPVFKRPSALGGQLLWMLARGRLLEKTSVVPPWIWGIPRTCGM